MDFTIGSVATRKGTRSAYSYADAGLTRTGTVVANEQWVNPNGVLDASGASLPNPQVANSLVVTGFGFTLPPNASITKILVNVTASSAAPATLGAQLQALGVLRAVAGYSLGPGSVDLNLGGIDYAFGITPAMVNAVDFGILFFVNPDAFPLSNVTLSEMTVTVFYVAAPSNFDYLKTFVSSNGTIRNLFLDSAGSLFLEDIANAPGELSPLLSGLPANGYARSITAFDREYVAFSNLRTGNSLPLQYTGDWFDRITQVGPGAPPVFTPNSVSAQTYGIVDITQPAPQSRGFSYFLRSSGPGSNTPGTNITLYYSDSTVSGPDADLVAAFNSGQPVYAYVSFTGTPQPYGPLTVLITSVGLGAPPGQPRQFYYFTFADPTQVNAYTLYAGSGHAGYTANYQRSVATVHMAVPVPGISAGSSIAITGNSTAPWNATWPVTQALNSGSMVVTQSSLTAGVATFSYAVSSGANPTAGQLVTIANTLNANGILNGANLTIDSVSGTSTGTFTVSGYSAATDYTATPESGSAVTAGTLFTIEPGIQTLGSATSPIYGPGTGGQITIQGNGGGQTIGSGIRRGVVFFITRNDAWTFPSTPIEFTCPEGTTDIAVALIPLGPPNVIARGIAITEAGQNGIPGANFYTLENPVTYQVNGMTYQSDSFIIHDNVTSAISLKFRDIDLLSSTKIDVQGNDLFNQIEIGNPAWITQYAQRTFYGLTQSKVQNFTNLSFDGGYLAGAQKQPLGWTVVANTGGQLITSAAFGNSYLITGTNFIDGLIAQSAYRDFYGVPIIRPNVLYSVRVSARTPTSSTAGLLTIELIGSSGIRYGFSDILLSQMSSVFGQYEGVMLSQTLDTVPEDLLLRVFASGLDVGSQVEVDLIEVFPTRQPVNETRILVSYPDNAEGVDGISGALETNSENTQVCYGAVVMQDLLYLLKERSMYYTQDSSGDEPDGWGIHEVSNKAGACGINAYDTGEEWIVMANRNGVYVFTGSQPGKVSQELQPIWDAINWEAGISIWLRNDIQERKFYVGVPLPTPNKWLPDAPTNAAPSYPNVILLCDYQAADTGGELAGAQPVYATAFGNLDSSDMRRKWSIWQIPCPYADFLTQADGVNQPLRLGNGIQSSKVYALDATNDDGAEIPWRYVTYGFGNDTDEGKYPVLGSGRKRWSYFRALMEGAGTAIVNFRQDTIDKAVSVRNTFTRTLGSSGDLRESSANAVGNRVYVEFESGGIDSAIDLSQLIMTGKKDTFNEITGKS